MEYTAEQAHLPDGGATIRRLPGVEGVGNPHKALFAATRAIDVDRVAVIGPRGVPAAIWAARSGAHVTYIADSAAVAQSLSATLRENGLPHVPSMPDWRLADLQAGACDLALLHLPRGRELQSQLIQLTATLLVPGGRLVLMGAKNEGIKGAVKEAARVFGRAGVVARKGGFHAAIAFRRSGEVPMPEVCFASHEVVVGGEPTELIACAGAFAPDRVDGGAAALIAAIVADKRIAAGSSVLDLGCGTGLVALAAARLGANVQATDVSARAIESARRTLAANEQPHVALHHCPGAAAVPDASVDTVVTNPPFHAGHDVSFEVSRLFVREARRVLVPGGRVFLVANQGLDYGRWLREQFDEVGTAYETSRFRLWCAR